MRGREPLRANRKRAGIRLDCDEGELGGRLDRRRSAERAARDRSSAAFIRARRLASVSARVVVNGASGSDAASGIGLRTPEGLTRRDSLLRRDTARRL